MPAAATWDPQKYLQFEEERTLPCRDLVRRITLEAPDRIVDLGCGTGTSTAVLAERWPRARLLGIDQSTEMLERARTSPVRAEWSEGDLTEWRPASPFDLVFSNAVLQWLPDHSRLIPRLWEAVGPHGGLAFQVPARPPGAPEWARAIEAVVARSPDPKLLWDDAAESDVRSLPEYYDILGGLARRVDLWDTEYVHVLPGPGAVVDWIRGTALRPLLARLTEAGARDRFLSDLTREISERYPGRSDGKVLFPFLRRFVVAYR
jgi:trans-aconitate 2-methyltransferase